jgi:hypothetical protein
VYTFLFWRIFYSIVLSRYDTNGRFQIQGGKKLDFAEIDHCKPVLLRLSLAGNLVKRLTSLYGTEWRERVYGLYGDFQSILRLSQASQAAPTCVETHPPLRW